MTEKHRLGQALTKSDFKVYIMNGFFVAIAFKGIRRCVQAAKQRAV